MSFLVTMAREQQTLPRGLHRAVGSELFVEWTDEKARIRTWVV